MDKLQKGFTLIELLISIFLLSLITIITTSILQNSIIQRNLYLENSNYLEINPDKKKKIVSFIIGGPNKYYDYSDQELHKLFTKVKILFTPDKFKIVIIPSYRTPEEVIKKANGSVDS